MPVAGSCGCLVTGWPPYAWLLSSCLPRGRWQVKQGKPHAQARAVHSPPTIPSPLPALPRQTFRSKEISKSNVVDDMVQSNSILYG